VLGSALQTSAFAKIDSLPGGAVPRPFGRARERHARQTRRELLVKGPALGWSEIYGLLSRNRGDSEAYSALIRRVRAIARPALHQHGWQIVDDVVADTCSAVAVTLQKARGPDTFRGFVIGIYLNTRRFYLEQRADSVALEGFDLPAVPESALDYDALALLQQCVGELPPREQSAVRLRFFQDAPYAQIAQELEVTENNARQIVHSARAHLSACAKRLWPQGRG
jgi:RNA polymerase sigma factor (sigma-70 family)